VTGATGRPSDAVAAIERELASIWTAPDPATGVAKVRASTLNYVAAAEPSALEGLREMTDQLAETHAGRVLLLWIDGRLAPWELAHEVSGVCRPSAGTSVCNDRVEIGFGAVAAERAASVVRALVLPEIPVVAEVAAGAPSMLTFALVRLAQRVVVDSRRMRLVAVAELLADARGQLADRAWIRGHSVRELVARFFDDEPAIAADVRKVRIVRPPPVPGGADPAHLMLGWLSSRLGWSEIGRGVARRADGGAVEVAIEEGTVCATEPGELGSIEIEAGGEHGVVCALGRVGEGRDVHWRRGRRGEDPGRAIARDLALGHRDETWVLTKAIEASEGDRVYRESALAGARWEAWGA
jgi:glucose-6-phosphate dehydrogenase assembly protein OpcA